MLQPIDHQPQKQGHRSRHGGTARGQGGAWDIWDGTGGNPPRGPRNGGEDDMIIRIAMIIIFMMISINMFMIIDSSLTIIQSLEIVSVIIIVCVSITSGVMSFLAILS